MSELDGDDIQGNILHPYRCGDGFLDHAAYAFLEVLSAPDAGRWLHGLDVTTDAQAQQPLSAALNIAFTWRGLERLRQPMKRFDGFGAFRKSMSRAVSKEASDREWFDNWSGGHSRRHILVTLYRDSATARDEALCDLHERLPEGAVARVCSQVASRLPTGREHFGFKDGLSQPAIEGTGRAGAHAKGDGALTRFGRWRRLAAGEFILGYPDEEGVLPKAPVAVGANGTFMVWQRLAQDVPLFSRIARQVAGRSDWSPETAAARLIGRRQDGSALARRIRVSADSPRSNDFRYTGDPFGMRCPLGAHIRRANPRDFEGFRTRLTERHRIIRRGLPYGTALEPDESNAREPRGLVFACFNASIERQFETVKMWCADGNIFRLGHDRDVLAADGDQPFSFRVTGRSPVFVSEAEPPVRYTGGEYLFVPGIAGLGQIADDALRRGAAA